MRSVRSTIVAVAVGVVGLSALAPGAQAAFRITSFNTALSTPGTVANPSTTNQLTAGAHPDLLVRLDYSTTTDSQGGQIVDGSLKQLEAGLPRGLTANPTVAATCPQEDLAATDYATCPVDSQVGVANIRYAFDTSTSFPAPVYNMDPPDGVPAQFAFNVQKVGIKLNAKVRTGGDYGLSAAVNNVSQALPLAGTDVTLWGVPADPVHDADRYGYPNGPTMTSETPASTPLPRQALINNPTQCTTPGAFTVSASSWQRPDLVSTVTDATEPNGRPYLFSGCERLPFEPTASVRPTTTAPDSPTGLDVAVRVPQSASPDLRATSHLKDLRLTLPPGMAVNPSGAAGLGSCAPSQIALASAASATCPDSSRLGSAQLSTPLLRDPLRGSVYLASQGSNPFGSLLAVYVVIDDQGVVIKLPGKIDADPATGQLVATFSQNPQLPFSALDVHLDGGPQAPLTTPPTCGPQAATVDLTPWSGAATQSRSTAFSIDCRAGLGAFSPTFAAGTLQQTAGLASPLIVNVNRPDGQTPLNRVSLRLPTGLLARLRGVRRCTSAQADAGTCDSLARVGSATAAAGSGPQPYSLPGDVFLTGPYKGAPFGLAVRIRAVAGPFDLGTVVVRQALFIDPEDTHVTVVSDPLPTILQGIPIRLRSFDIDVDRPGFAVNPTSCDAKRVRGNLGAVDGRTVSLAVAFRAGSCPALKLRPKLNLRLLGRGRALRDGGHPALKAILTEPTGQSNFRRAEVKLPLSLALDPDNAQTLCDYAEGRKSAPRCPKGSIVGAAKVRTPLLERTVAGPVYFVKGQRTDRRTGRVVRTLPTLVLPLTGDGVRIVLRSKTAVSGGRLVATFDPIPDAPVSRFDLSLKGGGQGILVANSSICAKPRTFGVGIRGQNGALSRTSPTLAASCSR